MSGTSADLGTYKRLRPGAAGIFTGLLGASSPKEAKARGLKTYSTGRPCKAGHAGERYASTGHCVECAKAHSVAWKAANPERQKALEEAWKAAHPDKVKARAAAWYEANRDREKARHDRRRAEGLKGESWARHYAGPRCPSWTREDPSAIRQMQAVYRIAHALGWEVDHVIPLRGADVSGLHVPGNLCIRPSFANKAKGSTHADEHPEADALTAAALLWETFKAIPVTAGAATALRLV